MLRLFDRGNREEDWFVEMLRGAGAEVWPVDPATKEQWRVTDFGGHFKGHADGVCRFPDGTVALTEFKTYNTKRFTNLTNLGVQKESPKYYAQMQVLMHHLKLTTALFMAVNKNNDELHIEFIPYAENEFLRVNNRIETVLNTDFPPAKISDDPTSFACRFCGFNSICHMGVRPVPHCRNCASSRPVEGGWECARGYEFGTVCPEYQDITKPGITISK